MAVAIFPGLVLCNDIVWDGLLCPGLGGVRLCLLYS